MKKLKDRWNIDSNWQLTVIFVVFAITGSTAAKFAGPVSEWIGLSKDLNPWIYWPVRLLLIFPIYQETQFNQCLGDLFSASRSNNNDCRAKLFFNIAARRGLLERF